MGAVPWYLAPLSQYFEELPFPTVPTASILGHLSISLAHLDMSGLHILHCKIDQIGLKELLNMNFHFDRFKIGCRSIL